jgi:putative acetyltransferase
MQTITIENPDQPEIHEMFDAAAALYAELYPDEPSSLSTVADLSAPGTVFWVVREDGAAIGCGALTSHGDWAEIKQMYVTASSRGKNVGALILETIEDHAKGEGVSVLRLDTAHKQAAAVSLYRSRGYQPRGPFGDHSADAISLFMEKRL